MTSTFCNDSDYEQIKKKFELFDSNVIVLTCNTILSLYYLEIQWKPDN
jgi:hypothetical protein